MIWGAIEVILETVSPAHSEADISESIREFQSLVIVWGKKLNYKYQPHPTEMPGNDDSWYTYFGEQGHLWMFTIMCHRRNYFCRASLR